MNNSIVVSNSTPIILLQKIGQLGLVQKLYSKIYIAKAVFQEVIIDGADKIEQNDFLAKYNWIEIVKIKNVEAKQMFTTSLHDGEVETMILAMEKSADLCILDDLLARKYAKRFNLNITGTLGLLIAAKKRGIVKEIKPLIEQLVDIGMFVGRDLYNSVISMAREE